MAILVVDDSRAMRMIVMRELRKAGYETRDVMEAENGRAALEKVREGGVDLVLSDWNMPEMSGMNLLQALRGDGNNVPFGFVTSESTPVMHRDALDAGADCVVTKPFSGNSLAEQVELALGGHRQADGLGAAVSSGEATVASVLSGLLGCQVSTSPAEPPRAQKAGVVARYRGNGEPERALFVAEIDIAAALGAALSRVPAGAVEDMVAEGALPEAMQQNVYEVVNVLSKAVPGGEQRWLLEEMQVYARLSEHAQVWAAEPGWWRSPVEVRVPGYPSGRAGFLNV